MSLSKGSEIFPSGRTTTSDDSAVSCQNTIDRTSSGPMTKSGGSVSDATGAPLLLARSRSAASCAMAGALSAPSTTSAHAERTDRVLIVLLLESPRVGTFRDVVEQS